MIGRTVSHFRILEPLGSGGMGMVYRARDLRLERDVAIKVLPSGALADEAARRQFRKEALALSRLNHPNIATIFELDSQEGLDFLVMELVPGKTLSDSHRTSPRSEKEIAQLGEQMAEGLAAAHRERLLHRDIKPANLCVTEEGQLKILDFGLAKLVATSFDRTVTDSGMNAGQVAGTLRYMSPEQLQGQPLDARTDLFSAGAVLYELAAGRPAFPQETAATLAGAILAQSPTPLHEANPLISAELERIVFKCLQRDPRDRYQSASELAIDLRRLASPSSLRPPGPAPRAKRKVPVLALAAVPVGLTAVALFVLLNGGAGETVFRGLRPAGAPSLAVLPFVNLSGDPAQDYFADGMTDELITRLAQVSALQVISRASVMQYKGTSKSLKQIAKELHVQTLMEGSVVRAEDRVRVSAQLVEAANGRTVWAESYERDLRNVLALQSDVAQAVVRRVQVSLTPRERGRLARSPSVNPEAHEAYLRGLAAYQSLSRDGVIRAIDLFRQAAEADPTYPEPWVGLSYAYQWATAYVISPGEGLPKARAAAQKALELDPGNASALAALAIIQFALSGNASAAEDSFREALALGPGNAVARLEYGTLLVCQGRFDEAIVQIKRAREIDPLSPVGAMVSLFPLFEGRRFREAAAAAQELLRTEPNSTNIRMIHGQALLYLGQHEEAIGELRRAIAIDPGNLHALAWLGFAYGFAGRLPEARQVLRRLEALGQTQNVHPYMFAIVYIGIGEKDEAFRWLEKAADNLGGDIIFIRVDPALDALRGDPRFRALLVRVGRGG